MNMFSRWLSRTSSHLTYSQKFAFITLVFVLPVIAFIPLFSDQLTRIDQYGRKELSGTLYLRPIWELAENVQSYVVIAQEYSNGNRSLGEVQATQATVDTSFESVQEVYTEYGASILPNDHLNPLSDLWAGLKASVQNGDWQSFEAQYPALLNGISDLTARVGDSSYLILDPDLDTYYLMDTVLLKLPENQSLVFDILQISAQTTTNSGLTAEDRAQLFVLTGRIQANLEAIQRNINVSIQNDQTGAITGIISAPLAGYQTSLQEFTNGIIAELNQSEPSSGLHEEISALYQNVHAADDRLYSAASQALELGVTNRIDTLSLRLYWIIGIALLSILIATLIGFSTMQSISQPLLQLANAAERIASGDLTTRMPVSQTKELGQVSNAFNQMATELERDNSELLMRTSELTTARFQSEKRTTTLQVISEISHIVSGEQRTPNLLPLITSTVSEKLNLHHCGVFLVDENREFAVLQSASTPAGYQRLQDGYKLKLGGNGLVESVITSSTPRLARSADLETSYINEPGHPKIRSFLVLPLRVARDVIGALDVQSPETDAFDQEDIDAFVTLADQIAITIQNARLFDRAQQALKEAETASRQITKQAWAGYLEGMQARGYRHDGIKPEALKSSSRSADETDDLLIPIQLRGQTIGRLKLRPTDKQRNWTEDEQAIVTSTAERVALAIESVRLLEDAQKRATREELISEISAKLGSTFQLDSILRDTVEELGQTLMGTTVSFQLVNPSAPPTPGSPETDGTSARKNNRSKS